MGSETERYPKNAPGPFYVSDNCCIACMAPHGEAPELMGWDDDAEPGHCFFKRQPVTPEEQYRAIRALWSSDTGCLRYAGDDPQVLQRLAEVGAGRQCDRQPADTKILLRCYVTFACAQEGAGVEARLSLAEVLAEFREFVNPSWRGKASEIVWHDSGASFSFSWYEENYHEVAISQGEAGSARMLVYQSSPEQAGGRAVSYMVDDWLRGSAQYEDIRWYTAEEWHGARTDWQPTPV